MRNIVVCVVCAAVFGFAAHAREQIGPWNVLAAPVSARPVIFQANDGWLNIVPEAITVNDAFSGESVIDDGWANMGSLFSVEMTFAPGTAVNRVGNDLVLFDAAFGANAYRVYTSVDGFSRPFEIRSSAFTFTGVSREYCYGLNPDQPLEVDVRAAGIDLSFWGVPMGGQVPRVLVQMATNEADLLGVGSLSVVPAPGCGVLLVMGCVATFGRRPR